MKKLLTLCLIHKHPQILLGMKKRGFGEGRWNGFGGKVQEGETIEDAARRELLEEAGIEASLEKVGILTFEFPDTQTTHEGHIFRAEDFSGEITEGEEMRPAWFHIDEIPFDSMWETDRHWLPVFLKGKKFKGRFVFGPNDSVAEYEMEEVEEL